MAPDPIAWYASELDKLTFNSKPLITQLTVYAQRHPELAPQLAGVIAGRIMNTGVPIEAKLATLYVMDSITKNAGEPYRSLFGASVVDVFGAAWASAPPAFYPKLTHLFDTWGPHYPAEGLQFIEGHLQLDRFRTAESLAKRRAAGLAPPASLSTSGAPVTALSALPASKVGHGSFSPFVPPGAFGLPVPGLFPGFPNPSFGMIPQAGIVAAGAPAAAGMGGLLASLASAGMIHSRPTGSGVGGEVGLDSLTFSTDNLRSRGAIDACVQAMYFGRPYQCSQCGRRFLEQGKLDTHVSWHKSEKVRKHKLAVSRADGQHPDCRGFMAIAREWIIGKTPGNLAREAEAEERVAEAERLDSKSCVPQDESQSHCAACGEEFSVFWSESDEAWMYRSTKLQGGRIVHTQCAGSSTFDLSPGLSPKASPAHSPEQLKLEANAVDAKTTGERNIDVGRPDPKAGRFSPIKVKDDDIYPGRQDVHSSGDGEPVGEEPPSKRVRVIKEETTGKEHHGNARPRRSSRGAS